MDIKKDSEFLNKKVKVFTVILILIGIFLISIFIPLNPITFVTQEQNIDFFINLFLWFLILIVIPIITIYMYVNLKKKK